MPDSCAVPQCKDFASFGFPRDQDLRLQWRVAINRMGRDGNLWEPTPHSKVCANHFKAEDFRDPVDSVAHLTGKKRRMLKASAVPSILLKSDDPLESAAERERKAASRQKVQMLVDEMRQKYESKPKVKVEESKGLFPMAQKWYACPICSESVHSFDAIHKHLQQVHHFTGELFRCKLCHYMAPKRDMWISHYSECRR